MVNAATKVGIWMILSWVVILGPVGFAMLGALAYATYFSNLALGMISCAILFSPLLFMAVWVPLMGAAIIVERSAARQILATEKASL